MNSAIDKDSSNGDNHSWGLLRSLRKNYSSVNLRQAAKDEVLRETSLDTTSLYGTYRVRTTGLTIMLTYDFIRLFLG